MPLGRLVFASRFGEVLASFAPLAFGALSALPRFAYVGGVGLAGCDVFATSFAVGTSWS